MEYNQRLLKLYKSKLPGLVTLFNELNATDENFSWPLMLRIWEEDYETAPVKLMVFGKETYGWNNHTEPNIEHNTVETLTEEYVRHNMGRDRNTPFWRTVRKLNEMLGNPDTNCFVWNNILKIGKEVSKGAPSDGVLEAEMEFLNVIEEEVKILKPEVCIFLTGHRYDSDIQKKLPGVEFLSVEDFDEKYLVQVKHKVLPEKSFRTYHPGHFQRRSEVERINYYRALEKIIELSKK